MNTWSFDIHGTLPAELKERGVSEQCFSVFTQRQIQNVYLPQK